MGCGMMGWSRKKGRLRGKEFYKCEHILLKQAFIFYILMIAQDKKVWKWIPYVNDLANMFVLVLDKSGSIFSVLMCL